MIINSNKDKYIIQMIINSNKDKYIIKMSKGMRTELEAKQCLPLNSAPKAEYKCAKCKLQMG